MNIDVLNELVSKLPRKRIGFYPTPFHKLENLSRKYGVNFFMKREDMAGPGPFSGSKTRLSEFIIGQALRDGVTHLITQGAHLTNSGLQFAIAARQSGITPILYLTRDEARLGPIEEFRGNLLLNKLMGVEVHIVPVSDGNYWDSPEKADGLEATMRDHRDRLNSQGHHAIVVPTGGAHPHGFVGHTLTFMEMLAQSESADAKLDYIYHTAGTGTALPGLLAAKFLTGSDVRFRSISICSYQPDYWMNKQVIADRVRTVFETLGLDAPDNDVIVGEIDVDERFIGEDYAVPSPESVAAIRELAESDGMFVGPVYTGKGFAGLLDHVRTGKIERGANVAFLHTGDVGNLFEVPEIVGAVLPNQDPSDVSGLEPSEGTRR